MATRTGTKDKVSATGVEFLTKNITFYTITGATNIHVNPGNADSVLFKTVQAIASENNIVILGAAAANDITVGLEGDYAVAGSTASAAHLKAVIDRDVFAGASTVTVTAVSLSGDVLA
mgnify:CR=1 FL=1